MANIDDYKTELQTLANTLDSDLQKYKALVLIDQYIDALTAQGTATSTDVASYSIGGRTVTRKQVESMQRQAPMLEAQINEIFYGNISYADFRTNLVDYAR